jgi:hypothetical protein
MNLALLNRCEHIKIVDRILASQVIFLMTTEWERSMQFLKISWLSLHILFFLTKDTLKFNIDCSWKNYWPKRKINLKL